MTRLTHVLLTTLLLFAVTQAPAQEKEKPETETTTMRVRDGVVRFSLTSSRPFIFGSNTYALYIGNKEFTCNEQHHHKGRGFMTFLIDLDEATAIQEGADMYLTYGTVNVEEEDMATMARDSRKCWYLGKYHKSKLTK